MVVTKQRSIIKQLKKQQMKHQISELEKTQNPQLEAEVGDKVDEKDIIYPIIPNDPTVGSKAETVIAKANPSHYENNKINVVDGDKVIRTYSGVTDGQNWKKYAELYAKNNEYELAPYSATLAEKAGIEADPEAQAEEQRLDEEAEAERQEAEEAREKSLGNRIKKTINKIRK